MESSPHTNTPSASGPAGAGEALSNAALKGRAVRGLKLSTAATAGKTLVDLGGQLIIARLLLPEHFGFFAFALALTVLVSCFTDSAGLKFLVRRREWSQRTFSTVFWFELSLGVLVAGAWALLCVPLLTSLGRPEQVPFAQALCLWIVAERLLLPRAKLDFDLKFGRVNGALLGGVVVGVVVLVGAAALGFGAWSFVFGLVARSLASAVFVWTLSDARPGFEFDRGIVRELLPFGAPMLLATALTVAYTQVDYLIVEALLGYTLLGFYYAAYRYPHYLHQFNVVLGTVVFPTLSKTRDDAHLARGLRLLTRYSALVAFVPVVAMWTEGEFLLRVLLGERWLPALFAFQCFTTLAAMRLAFVHWNQVLVVKGRTTPVLWASAANLPLVILAAVFGAKWAGIEGAALGVTISSLAVLAVCCGVLLKRAVEFSYLEALAPALRAALAALGVMVVGSAVLPAGSVWSAVNLALGGSVYGAVALVLLGGEMRGILRSRG